MGFINRCFQTGKNLVMMLSGISGSASSCFALPFALLLIAHGSQCEAGDAWVCQDYANRVKVVVDTGMYSRENPLVKAAIPVKTLLEKSNGARWFTVAICQDDAQKESSHAILKADANGNLNVSWILKGKVAAMELLNYHIYLKAAAKPPRQKTTTPSETGDNLLENPSFEKSDDDFWPTIENETASARISDKGAVDGDGSYMMSVTGKNRSGYINCVVWSKEFRLKPNKKYSLSANAKVLSFKADKGAGCCVMIALYFLDKNKKIVSHKIDKHNRDFVHWVIKPTRVNKEDFLNKWLTKSLRTTTPRWTRYGKIRLTISFVGSVLFDKIGVTEVKGEKLQVELGELETINGG